MNSNVGHTLQKMIHNCPVAVTTNLNTTSVVTNGGNVYQAGLTGDQIQPHFNEIFASENMVGRIIDAEATDNGLYLLSKNGSVYEYVRGDDCNQHIREVYSPAACGGDKAKKIASGNSHVLILTEGNKVFGAGKNNEYQLVPQGQNRYDTAVEVIVTDTNLHDNNCCEAFTGVLSELNTPVIPKNGGIKSNVECIKDTKCDVLLGYLDVTGVTICPPNVLGTLGIPVYGDIQYVGILCVDCHGCVSGSLTYTITRIYIKCGCFMSRHIAQAENECIVKEFNTSNSHELVLFESSKTCPKSSPCAQQTVAPITGVVQINGKCGGCVDVDLDLTSSNIVLPTVVYDPESRTFVLTIDECQSTLSALCNVVFVGLETASVVSLVSYMQVPLNDCCPPESCSKDLVLPQPCWTNIYAGGDISVLVDSCNRLYLFGSLYEIRSNRDLLKKSCLEELLGKTNASISLPASQLNCDGREPNYNNCNCTKCKDTKFKIDLEKFGIHLSFPNDQSSCNNLNVCEFLSQLKRCNETRVCEPTCHPCDGYIYLNILGDSGCNCGAPSACGIGSVTLYNKKSVCKLVSQGRADCVNVNVDLHSTVEYDLNKYCIDATDVSLDKLVKLDFCHNGANVNIYLDIDQPGGLKFTSNGKKYNVEFPVNASSDNHQFILNYGSILDPVELTNLKYALSLDCYFPCPKFKNPFDTKITGTYLRGGDHVKFVSGNPKNVRQAITPDVATVFRLNRRIVDVAVGNNSLTVLVNGLGCPNELFAIGNNCHGELGLGTYETVVCWKQLNRCIFDCQVSAIYAARNVTFYITQSYHVYASGQWKDFVNSNQPEPVNSICQSWKINHMSLSRNHIVLLGSDGCVFGIGENNMGELGLKHVNCVPTPTPLAFFNKLNSGAVNQIRNSFDCGFGPKFNAFNPCGNVGPCNTPCNAPCNAPCDNKPCNGPYNGKGNRRYGGYNPNNRLGINNY